MFKRLGLFSALWLFSWAVPLQAQPPLQTVLDLNRQGMDHYNNLELEDALTKLRQALDVCERLDVSGAPRARTLVNIGIVEVGGLRDTAAGLEAFQQAVRIDPAIRLDPLTATPDITTVFGMAQESAGTAPETPLSAPPSGGVPPAPPDAVSPPPSGPVPPSGANVPGTIPHTPVPEQLAQTAVPVAVEVPEEAPVTEMKLFYKSTGMTEYKELSFGEREPYGFGVLIPCEDVFRPDVSYYIQAFDENQELLAHLGTPDQPLVVPIVAERTGAAPALPGRPAPETCTNEECPPGMPGCEEPAGAPCVSDADCDLDSFCDGDVCVPLDSIPMEGEMYDDEEMMEEAPAFFFHAMGFWGSAYVEPGMAADSERPTRGMGQYDAWVGESGSPEAGLAETPCDDNGDTIVDYCVNIVDRGFVPTFGLRATVGYYFGRFGIAGFARWQPSAGVGTLSGLLFGARIQILATTPSPTGFHFAPFLGTSIGQIQPQPSQDEGLAPNNEGPFVRSGLNGIQIGGVFGYRFWRYLGAVITTEAMFQFPVFLFNIDISGGIEVAF